MKAQALLVLAWLVSGVGAVGGSIIGAALGQRGLLAGAIAGGLLFAALVAPLAARLGLIARTAMPAVRWGTVLGFAIAAPIAATNLHTPVIPVLVCSLAGVGALIGLGRAR